MATPGDRDASQQGRPDGGDDSGSAPSRSVLVAAAIGLLVTVLAGAGSVGAVAVGHPAVAAGLLGLLLVFLAALSAGTGD